MLATKNNALTENSIDTASGNVKLESEKIRAQIVEILESHGISESRLAREAGLSIQTVSAWLKGRYARNDIVAVEASLRSWANLKVEPPVNDFAFIPC